jgi:hypothetical protein
VAELGLVALLLVCIVGTLVAHLTTCPTVPPYSTWPTSNGGA